MDGILYSTNGIFQNSLMSQMPKQFSMGRGSGLSWEPTCNLEVSKWVESMNMSICFSKIEVRKEVMFFGTDDGVVLYFRVKF